MLAKCLLVSITQDLTLTIINRIYNNKTMIILSVQSTGGRDTRPVTLPCPAEAGLGLLNMITLIN